MSKAVEESPVINPTQIVYLAYQIRQLEIYRNDEKKANKKETMTMQIRRLKADLDPMLMAFAEQEKKKQSSPQMLVDRNMDDKDLGPPEIIDVMHAYARLKITQQEVMNHLVVGPVSVAGEYNKVAYIMHFQTTDSL
jgi:hypothetical protein